MGPQGQAFRAIVLATTLLLAIRTLRADFRSLLRSGAMALLLPLAVAVFFSPQWILWLTPLVLPLAAESRILTALWIALDLTLYASFPVASYMTVPSEAVVFLIWLRTLLLAGFLVVLVFESRGMIA
jgi:hypothetical protein